LTADTYHYPALAAWRDFVGKWMNVPLEVSVCVTMYSEPSLHALRSISGALIFPAAAASDAADEGGKARKQQKTPGESIEPASACVMRHDYDARVSTLRHSESQNPPRAGD